MSMFLSPAHPRSRGENLTEEAGDDGQDGSSPLTRGKPTEAGRANQAARLIPAHAGKTVRRRCFSGHMTAHPRSRGENPSVSDRQKAQGGSSPLTRGKRDPKHAVTPQPRLIPAHAGKTRVRGRLRPRPRAHPRSRGENNFVICARTAWTGSSPLTRGKHRPHQLADVAARLIPAHAGKTTLSSLTSSLTRAHPRSRGENPTTDAVRASICGSSPLTRGKRLEAPERRNQDRLIPAHAGKTDGGGPRQPGSPAHPRSRGENQHW